MSLLEGLQNSQIFFISFCTLFGLMVGSFFERGYLPIAQNAGAALATGLCRVAGRISGGIASL